jgi:hypothetical protein
MTRFLFSPSEYRDMNELTVDNNGLEIPQQFQSADSVVIRTPRQTTNIRSGFSGLVQDNRYALVSPEDFDVDEENAENPNLQPNQVSLKEHEEDEERYTVTLP